MCLNAWLLNLEISFQTVCLYSYWMVARRVVNCVTLISLFHIYGSLLEWSWAPAAQIDDLCAVDCHVFFLFPLVKMIFDSALASCTLNSRHYFMFYSSLFKIFTVVLLFVVLEGGGRSQNVILSVSCVPQMFIFSFMQKKKMKFALCMWHSVSEDKSSNAILSGYF